MLLTRVEQRLRARLVQLSKALPTGKRTLGKKRVRKLHSHQRMARLISLDGSFQDVLSTLEASLASPGEVTVDRITPRLVPVTAGSPEAEAFAAATLTWSVPVSEGFGRRMRFLVRDESNGKLIGVIGLTDPVFNLRSRDEWVGWSSDERKERLVHVMDAFVLGALPPYSLLLGGKLVALLAGSREVVKAFRARYARAKGIISKRNKDPRLVLLTTTSALGRSSVYNRLRMPGGISYVATPNSDKAQQWYTKGYGHFHLPEDVFSELQQVLVRREHPYAKGNRFGDGPNWKLRVIRQAAAELGISADFLRHNVRRQVFLVPLATNTKSFLLAKSKHPRYATKTCRETAEYWRRRWAIPRAERIPSWADWDPSELLTRLKRLRSLALRSGD